MKKIALLLSLAVTAYVSNAQLSLTTSPYAQNFDAIGTLGLPTGWAVYSASSDTALGVPVLLNTDAGYGIFADTTVIDGCASSVFGGGFKNYPSADLITKSANCAAQQACINRALGVRQVSPTNSSNPNLDSGAAFVLQLANTAGLTGFNLQFKLQSLDTSSPRETTWMVDYAIGNTHTFTPATTTTGYWITGGLKFSDTTNTVSFGTALDNQSQPVWIRIVTLQFSSSIVGTGNRASTAIDDYRLTFTGADTTIDSTPTAIGHVNASSPLPLTVLGAATSDNVLFGYTAPEAAAYTLSLYDLTGRMVYTTGINVATAGTQHFLVSGLNLAKGMYVAKMNNGKSLGVTKVMVQ